MEKSCAYPELKVGGQDWAEERERMLNEKHELLEENVRLRRDLLQLQQEHITMLQQLAVCHAAVQQQQQVQLAAEQSHMSSTSPEQPGTTVQSQLQLLPEQQQQPPAKVHPLWPTKHHHHHRHHHRQRSSRPPLTPQHQTSSSIAFLGTLGDGQCTDTCNSPYLAGSRPASRASQGSSTPRAKLHSSLQRLFGRTWVGQLQRSISSNKPSASSTFPADITYGGSSSTTNDGHRSTGNAQLDSSSGRNVVDVAVLTGLLRRGSGGGSSGGPQLQRQEGINSRAARISSGGAAAAALGAKQPTPHLQTGIISTGQRSGAGNSRHGSGGGNGGRTSSSGGNCSSWRNRRPAALTHLRPVAAMGATSSINSIVSIPASSIMQPFAGGAMQGVDAIQHGYNSNSRLAVEAPAADVWEIYGPTTCPAAVLCDTPWGESPGPVQHYHRSGSSSSSSGSSCTSSDSRALDEGVEPVMEQVVGLTLSREGADRKAHGAAAAARDSSSAGWSNTSTAFAGTDDCLPVADADSYVREQAGASSVVTTAATGCPCGSSASIKGAEGVDTSTTAAPAAAGEGTFGGSSTSSKIDSITSSSCTASLAGNSSGGGCIRSNPSGLVGRASTSHHSSKGACLLKELSSSRALGSPRAGQLRRPSGMAQLDADGSSLLSIV